MALRSLVKKSMPAGTSSNSTRKGSGAHIQTPGNRYDGTKDHYHGDDDDAEKENWYSHTNTPFASLVKPEYNVASSGARPTQKHSSSGSSSLHKNSHAKASVGGGQSGIMSSFASGRRFRSKTISSPSPTDSPFSPASSDQSQFPADLDRHSHSPDLGMTSTPDHFRQVPGQSSASFHYDPASAGPPAAEPFRDYDLDTRAQARPRPPLPGVPARSGVYTVPGLNRSPFTLDADVDADDGLDEDTRLGMLDFSSDNDAPLGPRKHAPIRVLPAAAATAEGGGGGTRARSKSITRLQNFISGGGTSGAKSRKKSLLAGH